MTTETDQPGKDLADPTPDRRDEGLELGRTGLPARGRQGPDGRPQPQCRRAAPGRPGPGLRPALAEDVSRRASRCRADPRGDHPDLEGSLRRVLAQGQPLLRAVDRASNRARSPLLNLAMPGKMTLSTGVLVIYADDESFAFMTPEGHQFAAWITFSSYRDDPAPVIQVQALMRASDPLYELSMPIVGHRMEDRFWVGHAPGARRQVRRPGRDGRPAAGLRRSPAPVALRQQHPPERRDPHDALPADPSGGLVPPQRESLVDR